MTISLTDNSPRIAVDFGSITEGQTHKSFTVSFEFFDAADLNVYINGTLKTLTTHYTVTGGNGSTGTISLSTAGTTVTDKVVITRDIALARTTDFPTSGPFDVTSLNLELDKFIAISADLKDQASRALQLTDFDVNANLTLPALDDRKGRVLAFNSTTGESEAGPLITSTQTVAQQAADIDTVAGIAANVTTVAGIQANVTTVANIDSSVTTVAGNTSNIATVVANITDIQNAEEHAQEAKDYATKVDGQVQENGSDSGNYASKAWAIGGTGVTDTAGSGAAKEWAVETSSNVDGTEYSAKEYSIGTGQNTGMNTGSAKQWALGGGASFSSNTAVTGGLYSAKYWAEQAAASVSDFDNKYHGPQSSDPTADPDSSALEAGDLYFNTTSNVLRVYNGSAWNDAVTDTTGFATNGFSIAMAIAL